MAALPINRLAVCGSVALLAAATCADAYAFQAGSSVARPAPSAAVSPLFHSTNTRRVIGRTTLPYPSSSTTQRSSPRSPFALCSSNSNDENNDADQGGGNGIPAPAPAPSMTLLERMDEVGQKLKPMAVNAKEQSVAATDTTHSILYTIKSCFLFTLFIFYRAYRGFFVLLPAVFRETYSKLESSSVLAPFVDESELDEQNRDVNPETGKVRFRTRATVSVLSMMVTLTYVVSGAWRVLMKLIKTLLEKGSMKNSFEAAADEVLENEDKIKKITENDGGRINGDMSGGDDGLMP